MFATIWEWIQSLWHSGYKLVALGVLFVALVGIAELAQSNGLGNNAFRFAARFLPWSPLFSDKAALKGEFRMTANEGEQPLGTDANDCPVGSKIAFSLERSRPGWIAAIGITDPLKPADQPVAVAPLFADTASSVAIDGEARYAGSFTISSADGLELFAIVGSDKPFEPEDVVPALRKLKFVGSKGATATLSGFDLSWTDFPIVATCTSVPAS